MTMMASALLTLGLTALHRGPIAPRARVRMSATHDNVHGEGGAYVGGRWVPLAECACRTPPRNFFGLLVQSVS